MGEYTTIIGALHCSAPMIVKLVRGKVNNRLVSIAQPKMIKNSPISQIRCRTDIFRYNGTYNLTEVIYTRKYTYWIFLPGLLIFSVPCVLGWS